jgi:tRNA-specific 2-thiouridylase
MSGGVDSSMTALLMQQAGYDCFGVHMQLASQPGPDAASARDIAKRLDMPFQIRDLSKRFHDEVIQPFVEGYEAGETPNPCIFCNKHLKFDALLQIADELGCDYLATGHYAGIAQDESTGRFYACTAADQSKDQSYVLYTLSQEQLARIVLPLGAYHKTEIRKMAAAAGFPNAEKSDSQDICFVPNGDYSAFIEAYRGKESCAGDMLDGDGNVVGKHKGLIHYTIGQRKGLGAHGRPVFVRSIDAESNTLTIGDNEKDLLVKGFLLRDYNWLAVAGEDFNEEDMLPCMIKVGYKHKQKTGTVQKVFRGDTAYLKISYDEPQRAVTPGQSAVFYNRNNGQDGDSVLGGGIIHESFTESASF